MKFDHKLIIRLWLLEPLQWTHRVSYIQLLYSLHRTRQRSVRRGKIKAFPYIPTTSICIFITLAIAPKYLYLLKFVWREHSNTPDNTPRGILVGMFSVTSNFNSNLTKSLILLIHNVWRINQLRIQPFLCKTQRASAIPVYWLGERSTNVKAIKLSSFRQRHRPHAQHKHGGAHAKNQHFVPDMLLYGERQTDRQTEQGLCLTPKNTRCEK